MWRKRSGYSLRSSHLQTLRQVLHPKISEENVTTVCELKPDLQQLCSCRTLILQNSCHVSCEMNFRNMSKVKVCSFCFHHTSVEYSIIWKNVGVNLLFIYKCPLAKATIDYWRWNYNFFLSFVCKQHRERHCVLYLKQGAERYWKIKPRWSLVQGQCTPKKNTWKCRLQGWTIRLA